MKLLVLNQPNPAGEPRRVQAQRIVAKLEKVPDFKIPTAAITSPDAVVRAIREFIGDNASERYLAIFLNSKNKVVGFEEFHFGSTSEVYVSPAAIIKAALLVNARGMITAHQHPSGDPTPSDADRQLWRKLRDMSHELALEMAILDNLVLGETLWMSEMDPQPRRYPR